MKIKVRKLQIARRTVQVAVILLLLLVPAIARYTNYVASRDIDNYIEDWQGSIPGATIAAIDSTLRALPGGEKERVGQIVRDEDGVLHYSKQFRGGPWSMDILGLSMSDPLGALESIVARKHVAKVVAISLIIPLVLTVLLGRIFCSWICPMGLLLELTDKFRGVMKFLELRPRNVQFSRYTKFALLAVGLIGSAVISIPILGYIYPPAIINREGHDLVFTLFDRAEQGTLEFSAAGLTWMSLILLGIALFEVFVSRRWWCRYVCPGGAVYSLLGARRPIRVKLIEPKCTRCTDCVVVCPMGLNPMNNAMGMECDNCGECISHCDDKALKYAFDFGGKALETNITSEPVNAK